MDDVLIVGAGTAGCVLAARLSEDAARRVTVVEAGPDFADEAALPEALRHGDGGGFDAGLHAVVCDGRTAPLARGRVVGGSSQVNGCGAMRALPADFDAWAARGLPEWSWTGVLDAYRRLETDRDFPGAPHHGDRGPVPIARPDPDRLSAPERGFLDAVLASGHAYRADMNAPGAVGIGPYPQNRRRRVRMSANLTHLAPARARPNLTVRTDTRADRIVVRDGRAVGIEADGELIAAREVICCAGVPMTPALLLRSGIGPAGELRAVGIDPVADLPAVGTGVYDQPGAVVPCRPAPGMTSDDPVMTRLIGRLAAIPGHPRDDGFYLNLFCGADPYEGEPVSAIMIGDMYPAGRGSITLTGAGTGRPVPAVDLGFYTAPGDLDRMRAAYRYAWALAAHPEFAKTITGIAMIDDAVVADDERLDEALRAMTFSRGALLGGARMGGGAGDSVVDAHCRVHGVAGLRVVDLSVVPVPLRAPTAIDAMMLGERTAGWIAAGR